MQILAFCVPFEWNYQLCVSHDLQHIVTATLPLGFAKQLRVVQANLHHPSIGKLAIQANFPEELAK